MSILKLHTRNTSVIIKTVKDLAKKQEKDRTSLKSEKKKKNHFSVCFPPAPAPLQGQDPRQPCVLCFLKLFGIVLTRALQIKEGQTALSESAKVTQHHALGE